MVTPFTNHLKSECKYKGRNRNIRLLPKLKWDIRKKDQYRERLNQNIIAKMIAKIVLDLEDIQEIIKTANLQK